MGLQNLFWQPNLTGNSGVFPVHRAQVSWVADIQDYDIAESSGLAASQTNPGLFWTINDSGSEPYLYAIDLNGRTRARVRVDTAQTTDWESLDTFSFRGKNFIAIGDTGDNFRWRNQVHILMVEEPKLHLDSSTPPITEQTIVDQTNADQTNAKNTDADQTDTHSVEVAWQVTYTYPQMRRDSEAMAVDAESEQIYVLSKRLYPPVLFQVPLRPESSKTIIAQQVTPLKFPLPTELDMERDSDAGYRHMPSGMDIGWVDLSQETGGAVQLSAQKMLLITTYQHAYLLPLQAFKNTQTAELVQIPLPVLGQREAIAFAHDSTQVAYVTKERRDLDGFADLFEVRLQQDTSKQATKSD